jgi:hypothetical protein
MFSLEHPFWHKNPDQVVERYRAWWRRDGLILRVLAPRDRSLPQGTNPQEPFTYCMDGIDTTMPASDVQTFEKAWTDPDERAQRANRYLARIYFGGDALPYFDTNIGPGNLATFLGSEPEFASDTVWYRPCITDLDRHPPLRFDPANRHFRQQKAIVETGVQVSGGRYLVSMPDLVENLDVLASLRGTQELLMDLVERPEAVKARLTEINQAYFAAFDAIHALIRDPWGGNIFSAFSIWGPGRTAKVQCDACVMISPQMFAEFVVPSLAEQCAWLDYSMYHLDGTQAIRHLDALLAIESLDAIEWTPQVSVPQGGSPEWYGLYRRILDAGKSVQAINVRPEEVRPLLDAVGAPGMFVVVTAESEAQARSLVETIDRAYR